MQQFIWTEAAVRAYGDAYDLQVLAVGRENEVVGVAPLAKRRHALSRLELLGVSELYEPMDFLYRDGPSAHALAEAIATLGSPLRLRRVPAESPMVGALQRAYRGRGGVIVRPVVGYPWIPLEDGWEEPEQQFNSGRRSDFRRMLRHAEKLGSVTFEVIAPLPAQVDPLLDEAYRVEAASWKGTALTAMACDPKAGAFYRCYSAAAARRGALRIAFMRIDEAVIAMQIAAECGGRFWLLKIGHDEEYSRCSPGTLLMLHTLRYAARRGLVSYEFLGTAEPWTRMWSERERKCVSIRTYPFRPASLLTFGVDMVRNAWPAVVSKLKAKL